MQHIIRRATVALAVAASSACSRPPVAAPPTRVAGGHELPTRYLADRFVVTLVTERGDTLELFTDTGGGANMLWPDAVARLALPIDTIVVSGDTLRLAALPPLNPANAIPPPTESPRIGARLIIPAVGQRFGRDGFLGRTWFADRVWLFDYPQRRLLRLPNDAPARGASTHTVPLGFQRDAEGRRTSHFPRIRIAVDGDSLDLLFDTGATTTLTDSAQRVLASWGDAGPPERGTSFITQRVFDHWRARHPDWRVLERADRAFGTPTPMIEVPMIAVAGYEVGPVWFTVRSTRSFEGMSTRMDQPVVGALGGSALRYFRVLVDYPRATATFERR